MVVSTHGAMDQGPTTGITKAIVCAILSVEYAYKRSLAANKKSRASSRFPLVIRVALYCMSNII